MLSWVTGAFGAGGGHSGEMNAARAETATRTTKGQAFIGVGRREAPSLVRATLQRWFFPPSSEQN